MKRFPLCRIGLGFFVLFTGCQLPSATDRNTVSSHIQQRMGLSVGPPRPLDQVIVPPGLALDLPIIEDHAVLLALWNNAAFQELLVDLQITKADLIQAGLLPNPEVVYFFYTPEKPFKYALDFPIEALWLRPIRIRAAERENARATERLTQAALDLIRDTRQAYSDLVLARERVRVADEAVKLRSRIAELAEGRLKARAASVQEVATAKIDALLAKQDLARIGFEVALAEERMKNLTGLGATPQPFLVVDTATESYPEWDADALVDEAVRCRPDAISAEIAVQAALERLHLAKVGWVRLLGILDATSGRNTGHEFGPAFRVTLPIFNRNQGGIARAEAETEQLCRRRLTVHNQIILDVKLAHIRMRQTTVEVDLLRKNVRPEVEAAIRRAENAYKDGNASYLLSLEASRQLIDTLNREVQLKADQRRAWADLERSVGRRLNKPEVTASSPVKPEPVTSPSSPPQPKSP